MLLRAVLCPAALEQQCDEHRKRAKELKSKSQHLNNVLMTLAPVPVPPPPKRPRLSRAVSGPPAVSAAPTQITLPVSQLSSLPLSKVLTVAGTQAGGYTFLTSQLSGAELAADGSGLTVLSTGQEGAAGGHTAFVKVMGPQFQLVSLPGGLQGLATTQGVQQQLGSISVVDTAIAAAEEPQEEEEGEQAGGVEEEAQPEQVKVPDGEQP